jgi:hypothetical protein
MTFDEAEVAFRDLYERMERGAGISRALYEDQVSRLAVQDEQGVWWEIHPNTARWMYFDGLRWVEGVPPGRTQSAVLRSSAPTTRVSPPVPPRTTPAPTPESGAPIRPGMLPQSSGTVARGAPKGRRATPTRGLGGTSTRNLEWLPFAVGAAVLFACAVVLFIGGQFALSVLGPAPRPTSTTLAGAPTTAPLPTAVALPILPLPTSTPVVVLAKAIENRVNVRAAPSTQAEIVGKIQRDDVIRLTGRNGDGTWYQVSIAGRAEPAWVFAATLQVTSGDAASLPVSDVSAP